MEVDFFNHTKAFKRINIIFKTLLFLLFIILLIFKSYNINNKAYTNINANIINNTNKNTNIDTNNNNTNKNTIYNTINNTIYNTINNTINNIIYNIINNTINNIINNTINNIINNTINNIIDNTINNNIKIRTSISNKINNETKKEPILEVTRYKNQTLKLFIPQGKCLDLFPKTIYFRSKFKNYNETKNIKTETIYLSEKNKSYFASYFMIWGKRYNNYFELLNSNGLIQSAYVNYSHNLFINPLGGALFKSRDYIFINEFQKKYSFLNTMDFHLKDMLYRHYMTMRRLFKDDYKYMPETYCYPRDKKQIEFKFNNYTLNLNNLWLVKPFNTSVGYGIHFLESLEKEIKERERFIITKFISKMDLIDNKKYDLRLYALITGLKPLRIYFYKNGLVRIASSVFNISKFGVHNRYMYLTNTGVNDKNKAYIFPNKSDDAKANIWNLKTYRHYLESKNVDYDALFKKIKDLIIKAVISFHKKLLFRNKKMINERNVFTILGIDILITDKFEPVLIEINNRPSLSIYDLVDEPIKTNLFADTLNIVGIPLFSRDNKHYQTLNINNTKDAVNNALCELYRPRGDYELIFPLKKNIRKYKKFFIKNYEENVLFWDKIK